MFVHIATSFFSLKLNKLVLDSRKLTINYRNFTFKRTYFIVVQQQHSSSKATQTERVGVGGAFNILYFII